MVLFGLILEFKEKVKKYFAKGDFSLQFSKNGQIPNFRPESYFLRSIIIISP
jgi:hypothetical protein